jgi:hypothetical protein
MLKGKISRDFRPSVFSLNGTTGFPDSWAKEVLNIDSNSRRNSIRFDYENRLRGVNTYSRVSLRIRNHIQTHFNLLISDP